MDSKQTSTREDGYLAGTCHSVAIAFSGNKPLEGGALTGQRSGLSSSSFRTKMEQSTSITKRLIFEEDVNTPVDINVCHRRMEELAKLPSHFKDLEEEAMAVAKLEIFSDSYLLGLEDLFQLKGIRKHFICASAYILKELILEMKSEYIDLAGEENGLESIGNDDLGIQEFTVLTENVINRCGLKLWIRL
eukprot:Gb_32053 [translate_table: standard]